jgi:hypothetical protein
VKYTLSAAAYARRTAGFATHRAHVDVRGEADSTFAEPAAGARRIAPM